jgi:RHS repeat-associated protein
MARPTNGNVFLVCVALGLCIFFRTAIAVADELGETSLDAAQVNETLSQSTVREGTQNPVAAAASELAFAASEVLPDPFTGAVRTSIPIEVPAGRSSMTPSVMLNYSTLGANGWLGIGWTISGFSIFQVRPSQDDAEVTFAYSSPSGTSELISHGPAGEYRSLIEKDRLRFRKLGTGAAEHWEVTDAFGRISTLGGSAGSFRRSQGGEIIEWRLTRQHDRFGNYIEYVNKCDGEADADGGCVTSNIIPELVLYTGNSNTGTAPSHCIAFATETRPDEAFFRVYPDKARPFLTRLGRIDAYANSGPHCNRTAETHLRGYILTYVQQPTTNWSALARVDVSTRNSPPPSWRSTNFTYYATASWAPDENSVPSPSLRSENAFGAPTEFADLERMQTAFVDITGDGLVDYCVLIANGENSDYVHTCLPGTSSGAFDERGRIPGPIRSGEISVAGAKLPYVFKVYYPDLNGDGRADSCSISDSEDGVSLRCWVKTDLGFGRRIDTPVYWPRPKYRNRQDVGYHATRFFNSVKFADIDGDSSADLCFRKESRLQCYTSVASDGFVEFSAEPVEIPKEFAEGQFAPQPLPMLQSGIPVDSDDGEKYFQSIQFVDLNADRKADICARTSSGLKCYLAGKSGGFDSEFAAPPWSDRSVEIARRNREALTANKPGVVELDADSITDWGEPHHWQTIRFADINGDGFPDVCGRSMAGLICHHNLGDGFEKNETRGPEWKNPAPQLIPVANGFPSPPPPPVTDWSQRKYFSTITFTDLNGDQKADVCARELGNVVCYVSSGKSFSAALKFNPVGDQSGAFDHLSIIDSNGDGLPEICVVLRAGLTCWSRGLVSPAGHLKEILSGIGGVTTIHYAPASSETSTRIPFPLHVTTRVISRFRGTSIGIRGELTQSERGADTLFSYSGGYFHLASGDFRGFSQTRIESFDRDAPKNRKITQLRFHQGDGSKDGAGDRQAANAYLKGSVRESETSDESGTLWTRTKTAYHRDASPPYSVRVADIRNFECGDNTCDGDPARISYGYDELGNLVLERHFGDPSTENDDFTIRRGFVSDASIWLIGLPAWEATYAGTSNEILRGRTATYYDDDAASCAAPVALDAPQRQLSRGKPTRIVQWNGESPLIGKQLSYDEFGNLVCSRDAEGRVTSLTYDRSHSLVASVVNAKGFIASISYYGVDEGPSDGGLFGQLHAETDANEQSTVRIYDEFGRPVRISYPDGVVTSTEYANMGDPYRQHVKTAENTGAWRSAYFDGGLGAWKHVWSGPGGKPVRAFSELDGLGRVTRTSMAAFEDSGSPFSWSSQLFDSLGRIKSATDAAGAVTESCFARRTSGLVTKLGMLERRRFDFFGRLVSVERFNSGDSPRLPCSVQGGIPSSSVRIDYDALGHPREIVDHRGHKTVISYDPLGRRESILDPDAGLQRFKYDRAGNVIQAEDGDGRKIFYTYDVLNRVVQRDYGRRNALGGGDNFFRYDEGPLGRGRVSYTATKSTSTSYQYDAVGRVARSETKIGKEKYTSQFAYSFGRLSEVSFPDGDAVRYEYDGEYLRAVVSKSGKTYARFLKYSALGQVEERALGDGTVIRSTYHADHCSDCPLENRRLCREQILQVDAAGTVLRVHSDIGLTYDAQGNIQDVRDASNSVIAGFRYDKLGRLTSTAGLYGNSSYKYDDLGNPVLRTADRDYIYTYDKNRPHAVKGFGARRFDYDHSGNLKISYRVAPNGSREPQSDVNFTYDHEAQLTEVHGYKLSESYRYDSSGRRVATETMWSTEHSPNEYFTCRLVPGSPKECVKSIRAGGLIIARQVVGSSQLEYHVLAATGRESFWLASAGAVKRKTSFDAFGNFLGPQEAKNQARIGFEQATYDSATNLYYLGARFYDPEIGRFITPDSFGAGLAGTDELNRYSYAENNPISMTDTDGKFIQFVIAGAIIGGLIAGVNSDWDLGQVIKGALVGAVAGGVGAWAGGAAASAAGPGGGVFGAAVGGAAGSATSAAFYGQNVFQAAAIGFIAGTFGDIAGRSLSPAAGGVVGGYVTAAANGEDRSNGMRWGWYGSMVSQLVVSNYVDTSAGEFRTTSGNLERNTAYALKADSLSSRIWTLLIADPFSHVIVVNNDGVVADATPGYASGVIDPVKHPQRWADIQGRIAAKIRTVGQVDVSRGAGKGYGIFGGDLVCTGYVRAATFGELRGFAPSAMHYGANGNAISYQNFWTRPPDGWR